MLGSAVSGMNLASYLLLLAVPPGLCTPAGGLGSALSLPQLAPVLVLAHSSGADPLLPVMLAKGLVGDK